MMLQYCEHFNITAELKCTDQLEWVKRMNMVHSICEEFIFDRIIILVAPLLGVLLFYRLLQYAIAFDIIYAR